MTPTQSRLFDLLPAIYKIKDAQIAQFQPMLTPAEQAELLTLQTALPPLTPAQQQQLEQLTLKAARGPLESILLVIDEQLAIMANNLDQLYDDLFIETCAPWVVPYIGDLIGYQSVHGIAPAVASPRSEVANTISFRRRKGTILVMEQLARDVTGWGAHAVEFFKLLGDTQYMNHIRPHNFYCPDLRHWKPRVYMNTGFDKTSHKVDVRRIAVERGRYNIQNIGIFLWTLNAYSLTMSPLSQVGSENQFYRFNLLGRDTPLFNAPVSQGPDITAPAEPVNVPNYLLRHVLCHDVQSAAPQYYGVGESLVLYEGGNPIPAAKLQVCDLSGPDGSWINVPSSGSNYAAAIDPVLGRIAFPSPGVDPGQITATYHYGFNAEMGGGEYPRESTFSASPEQVVLQVPATYPTISAAIAALPGEGVVEITDSGLYQEDGGFSVNVNKGALIELRAANGSRPTLLLGDAISVSGGQTSTFDINGLVIGYAPPAGATTTPPALIQVPDVASNQLTQLGLSHCTLVPGWALNSDGTPDSAYLNLPTVLVDAPGTNLLAQYSILGGLWIANEATANLTNCIVDATDPTAVAYVGSVASEAPQPGGPLTAVGCTFIGKVYASLLNLISDSICWAALSEADLAAKPQVWAAPLWATRKQQGCVRFSYLPTGAIVPRQFECVTQAKGGPQPVFYSLRYGDAPYCKLYPGTDSAIRQGADDGGEMGAFHFLLAPLRETDLNVRMQEYLPVGLEFGIFYEN